MNLETAINRTMTVLDGKQDPDEVKYIKQWDEFGQLKGWIVSCLWGDRLLVTLDMTQHYTRRVGDLEKVPDYKPGKHQEV